MLAFRRFSSFLLRAALVGCGSVLIGHIGVANAESISVKYRGPVPLDTFQCAAIDRSSFIERLCYDAAQEYMVILLKGTYYHYCEIDQGTVDELLGAESMGKYFIAHSYTTFESREWGAPCSNT